MKKIMVALAAVAMAMVAQASAVTWAYSGDIYQKNGSDWASGTGWVVFLGTDSTALGTWAIDATGAISTTDATLITFDSGENSVIVYEGMWNDGAAATSLCSQNGYYDIVLAYKDTNDNTWYYNSARKEFTEFTSSDQDNKTAEFSVDYAPISLTTPVEAAPEPTSGLLLLLGVAGLALRRRRA